MRILFLTQVVPFPPDSGPKVKTRNVLRYLAARHEVHLISFVRSPAETQHAQSLRTLCASVTTVPLYRSTLCNVVDLVKSLAARESFLVARDRTLTMLAAVHSLLARHHFDAVHADQISMAQYAVDLPVPLRVFDAHNAVWTIVRRSAGHESRALHRLLGELEWRKLRRHEGEMCRRFDHVTVVSRADQANLETAAGAPFAATTIPIAVDVDELAFIPRTGESRHVLSVATMFYPPNAEGISWFATQVLPTIRQQVPGTELVAAGSRPPRHIRRLASANTGVVVPGYVPDLSPLLGRSAVLVVPLHAGSGMRVKILEAFARGLPVVSTTVGAEGIDAQPGVHLLVADRPADFAAAVVSLLRDTSAARQLAQAARHLVETRYDWRRALAGLDRVYPTADAAAAPGAASMCATPQSISHSV